MLVLFQHVMVPQLTCNSIAPRGEETTQLQNPPKDITTSGSQSEEQGSTGKGEVEDREGESGEAPEQGYEDEDVKVDGGEAEGACPTLHKT